MTDDIEALLARLYHPKLKAIDPGLDRLERFLALIGSPQKRLPPVIHVAGTNGKGSLIAYLQAIFESAGYSVHRYISPHLVRFNERIVIHGQVISDDYLRELLQRIHHYIPAQAVTFFEATTAAALLAFTEHPADIVLLETGMGGRLDATNVITKPLLTAITPVSLDHCGFLGDTITDIAGEKAGIIKTGVPCIVGRQLPEALAVIAETADRRHAPLYRMDREWHWQWECGEAVYRSPMRTLALHPALAGAHQYDNAATAVACVDKLPRYTIGNAAIAQGLARANWPGRLQPLTTHPYANILPLGMELWLDGGHNPQGGEMLAQWLEQRGIDAYLICGMVKDKDTLSYLRPLARYVKALYAIAIPEESLSQPAQAVASAAKAVGMKASIAPGIENALQTIAHHAKTPAIVCICGSLYLAGKVLAIQEALNE